MNVVILSCFLFIHLLLCILNRSQSSGRSQRGTSSSSGARLRTRISEAVDQDIFRTLFVAENIW